MLPTDIVRSLLLTEFKLAEPDIESAAASARAERLPLETVVVDKNLVPEGVFYEKAAAALGVPLVRLSDREIRQEILTTIPREFAETHQVVAFDKNDQGLFVAVADPTDIQTIEFLRRKTGLTPVVHLAAARELKEGLKNYHTDTTGEKFITKLTEGLTHGDTDYLKKLAAEAPTVNIVNTVIEHAIYEGASDIHIEPTESTLVVRYRVDGALREAMQLPERVAQGIVARLKILANLKIDEHMIPQDGRFKIKLHDEQLSFRVSIIPVYDGEKIVMRVLQEGQKPLTLDELGFLPGPKAIVERAIAKPHGMVLVTGPTGSGKTTTLYSLLGLLNTPDVNICTIEDPIEYHVGGINQSQINPKAGFTFAGGLRAFLRQDPDIIMVGEIRDNETAELAIHAAMTGHLVLSTLHTNDAPTTIPRLADMDIPAFLIAFTANIIVAQRLVRKICAYCKQEYPLDKSATAELSRLLDAKKLLTLYGAAGIKLEPGEKSLETLRFFRGAGCSRCKSSGYKGRVGIYEVLEIDKELTALINSRASADEIKKYAEEKQGMITMFQDGLVKAKQGVTTIEEVLRATRD